MYMILEILQICKHVKGMRPNSSQPQLVGDVTFHITYATRTAPRRPREGVNSGATLRAAVISLYDLREIADRQICERDETKLTYTPAYVYDPREITDMQTCKRNETKLMLSLFVKY